MSKGKANQRLEGLIELYQQYDLASADEEEAAMRAFSEECGKAAREAKVNASQVESLIRRLYKNRALKEQSRKTGRK